MNKSKEDQRSEVVNRFWETIPPMWDRIRGHVRETVTGHFDITFEQFHILRHIRRGIVSVSELAEKKQISRPAISQTVDLLVNKGWVSRQTDAADRRYVQLALTPSGDELLDAIFRANRQWMNDKMANLTPDEIECLYRAMGIFEKTFCESKS